MVCIYCGQDTEVYNSRAKARTPSIWRRRRCIACVAQFTTLELPDYSSALLVRGHSDQLVNFSRDKLFLSLYRALGHRADALESATELTGTVIGKLLRTQSVPDGVLALGAISRFAHHALKRYDNLAAQTYLAYHQDSIS